MKPLPALPPPYRPVKVEEDDVKLDLEANIEFQLAKMQQTEEQTGDSPRLKDEEDGSEQDKDSKMDDITDSCEDTRVFKPKGPPSDPELEDILSGPVFSSSFFFSRKYNRVPNPLLRLEGIGIVGLPLSNREATFIISQKPSGEILAAQTTIASITWEAFMADVSKDVCGDLGVDYATSRAKHVLRKVSVCQGGSSNTLQHNELIRTPGTFAATAVFLSSLYTGGSARLSHGQSFENVDLSGGSLSSTSVVSWFTTVSTTIDSITEGCRIALVYDLVHSSDAPQPTLSVPYEAMEKARQALTRLANRAYQDPLVHFYPLNHKAADRYEEICIGMLQGVDARKVAYLQELGDQHGMRIGLAKVTREQTGSASVGRGRKFDPDRAENWKFVAEDSVEELVELDGTWVTGNAGFEHGMHQIAYGRDLFAGRSPDKAPVYEKEEDRYDGYIHHSLSQTVTRTLLAVWPAAFDELVKAGKSVTDYALTQLADCNDEPPTQLQRLVFRHLTASTVTNADIEAEGIRLCEIANRWRDADLWVEAMRFVTSEDGVYPEEVAATLSMSCMEALALYEFHQVRPILEDVLKHDRSVRRRSDLIDLVEGISVGEENKAIAHWLSKHRNAVMNSLQHCAASDAPVLLNWAFRYGRVKFLQSTIVPQLRLLEDPRIILDLTIAVWSQGFEIIRLDDPPGFDDVVQSLLSAAASRLKSIQFDETALKTLILDLRKADAEHSFSQESAALVATITTELVETIIQSSNLASPQNILDLFEFCCATDNQDRCSSLVTRITKPDFVTNKTTLQIMIPLLGELRSFLDRRAIRPFMEPYVSVFKTTILHLVMDVIPRAVKGLNSDALVAKAKENQCSCEDCPGLVTFLTAVPNVGDDDDARTLLLEGIGSARNKHIESKLRSFGGGKVASSEAMKRRDTGVAKIGLKVIRNRQLCDALLRLALQTIGAKALKDISEDPKVLMDTFGRDYPAIMNRLSDVVQGVEMSGADHTDARAAKRRKTSAAHEDMDMAPL